MKNFIAKHAAIFLVLCTIFIGKYSFAQIVGGTYNVGVGQTYTTIQEAIDSCTNQGISGHIVFNLTDAQYIERLDLNQIPGTNADSTITFQSASQNADDCMVIWDGTSSSDNYVLGIWGADYVTFQYMSFYNSTNDSYSRVVRFDDVCTHVQLKYNKFIGQNVSTTSTDYALIYSYSTSSYPDDLDYLLIEGNEFINGSYAIYKYHSSGSALSDSVKIINNTVTTYLGFRVDKCNAVQITGNTINTSGGDGMYLRYNDNNINISGNKISTTSSSTHSGIYLPDCIGSLVFPGIIANNVIYISSNTLNKSYGIYLNNSDYQYLYHNTVSVAENSLDSKTIYAISGSNIKVKNNLLYCNQGYVIYSDNTNISDIDYNNYYTNGNYIANWSAGNVNDLAALQVANGMDANSSFIYPNFISATDSLIPSTHWLDNTGTNLSSTVNIDYYNNPRSATPDVGAFEFTANNTQTYSDTITIKPAGGGTFTTFTEAVDSLVKNGVSGPVTIKADDGTYSEHILIRSIPGASATNNVTFISASDDSTKVNMEYETTGTNDNWVFYFYNCKYVSVKKMTLSNIGASYGIVAKLNGYAHHNSIENCFLKGSGNAANTNDRTVVYCNDDQTDNLTIQNNLITGGSRGIRIDGLDGDLVKNLTIKNNSISSHEYEIIVTYGTNFDINDNILADFTKTGLTAEYSNSPYNIYNNKLSSTNATENGIYLYQCNGSGEGGLIYNNFVHMGYSGYYVIGIKVYRSTYQSFYNNSVNVVSTDANSRAFDHDSYYTSETNIITKNNSFYVDGPGYAYVTDWSDVITASDYNNFYTKGSSLIRWRDNTGTTTNYSNLDNFYAATGMGQHSINYNPVYISESDLHTDSYWLDNAGTPLTQVTTDIDGEPRDGATPDIGADEFTSGSLPLDTVYTIGTGGDYLTLNDAINDLNLKGVLDTVIFNIIPGTYNEQIAIPQIAGAGPNAPIIFQSQSGNPEDVIINYAPGSSSDNYVIAFEGADYISIKNLTLSTSGSNYASIIVFSGNTEYITISNNIIQGLGSPSNSTNVASINSNSNPIISNTLIENNTFTGGSYGIYLVNSNNDYAQNMIIQNNTFNCHYTDIWLEYFEAPMIESNYLTYTYDNGYGIRLSYCVPGAGSSVTLVNNQVYADTYNDYGSIYLTNCDANVTYPNLLINNVVRGGSMDKSRHIGIHVRYSDYTNLYHNTVNISGDETDDFAFYAYTSDNLTLKNNNFAVGGSSVQNFPSRGYAVYITNGSVLASDNNNFYSSGQYIAKWVDSWYSDLASLQIGTGLDQNSVSVYPGFLGLNDLHTNSSWIDNEGTYLTEVPTDIDGNIRDVTNPSIGAYEDSSTFSPIVSGTYSVGTNGDFATADSLVQSLMEMGIAGPVTFNFKTGTYSNTNMLLKDIPGTSQINNVVFQSEAGDPDSVTFTYAQTSSSNYILFLNGTDYFTINNLSFTGSGSGYAHIIRMEGNVHDVNIVNNSLNGPSTTSNDADMASIYAQLVFDNIVISDNTLSNNSYGIYMYGVDSYNVLSMVVQNNTFTGQYRSVYCYKVDGPVIQNNSMDGFVHDGIYLSYCDEDLIVTGNKVTTSYDNVNGIYIDNCTGTVADQGLIANNFVNADGTGSNAYGINTYFSSYHRIYYNSINITGSNWGGTALYLYGGGNFSVLNNIIVHKLGYAYYLSDASLVTTSNYNNIYSENSHFAKINYTDYSNFAAFQLGLGQEANSVSIDPYFASESDLHLYNNDLMGLATPLSEVLTDIDGEVRDASTPDIGADELICSAATLNVPDYSVCQYETIDIPNNSTGYINGTVFLWDLNNSLPYEDTTSTFDTVFNYAFLTAGNYTAKLVSVQPGGCQDEITFNVIVYAKPDAPIVNDTVIGCYGHDMPPQIAEGTNIEWYNNTDLADIHLLFTGDSLYSGDTELGNYTYYATQTTNNCQSDYSTSILSIRETPESPLVNNESMCFGDSVPSLNAVGNLITWYADANLDTVLWNANDYTPEILAPGIYDYYVTQNNGECESFATEVTLTVYSKPSLSADVSNIDCIGNDFGSINLTVSNGEFPYFFAWSNGVEYEDITNLDAGDYFVLVTDDNGCQSVDTFTVSQPDSIHLELIFNDSECSAATGSATVTASGGNPPFEYQWSNGDDAVITDSLSSGIYIVTVSDQSGCTAVGVATINDLGAPTIDVNAVQDVSCYGGSNGQISVTVSGTATPFIYEWSNGETTEDISGLQAGPYQLQVSDTSGCLAVANFNITEPEPINIIMSTFEATCGQSNGSAVANVLGGAIPYSYDWSTGSTAEGQLPDLALGVYGLTVTDNNACVASKLFTISELGAPSVVVDSVIEGSCGNADGGVYISVYGSSDQYYFLWSNDSTSEDLIGVNAGEYNVVVTDTSGCSGAAVAVIEADKPPVTPICMVTVDTATNYNEIIWEDYDAVGLDHFNIYKESTQSDVYFVAGSVPADSLNIFVDTLSNSLQRSWRYKISAVDQCGVESDLSEAHKTMHLNVNMGVGNNINLIWEPYEGIDFDTYYIYRHTTATGWLLFDSIPDNITSYTDNFTPGEQFWYFIQLRHPFGCNIGKAVSRDNVRSNTGSTEATTLSSENDFNSYTFGESISPGGGSINNANHSIDVTVINGTDVTNLTAIFTHSANSIVKIGSTVQVSGTTTNSFTNPVVYTIIAEDGSAQDWTVTVTEQGGQSSENDFLTYGFDQSIGSSVINSSNHTVTDVVVAGTLLTSLTANFTSSAGSVVKIGSVIQESGVTANDFTNPLVYTIVAEDGSEQNWTVSVSVEGEPNSGTDFLSFLFAESSGLSEINYDAHTITAKVSGGADLTSLKAIFTLSEGATAYINGVEQESGVTANDFTNLVVYTIKAENEDEQTWIVDVVVTAIEDLDLNKMITIYPNPNKGIFTLKIEQNSLKQLNYGIYTLEGKIIHADLIKLNGKDLFNFDLSSLHAGVYYIKFVSENGIAVQKLIIK